MLKLKHKDIDCIDFTLNRGYVDKMNIVNDTFLPEVLKMNNVVAMQDWLSKRSIDMTRTFARLLMKNMHLGLSEHEVVLFNKALTLTDFLWVSDDSNSKYKDVDLRNKSFNKAIVDTTLSGIERRIEREPNPELTNIGSFNKAWIKIENTREWWLYKRGTKKQIYAELFTYYLGKQLGLDMAIYRRDSSFIASLNFTDNTKYLEHYSTFRYRYNNISLNEEVVYNNFKITNVKLAEKYLNILLLDAIMCNPDRHEYNFGVLKSAKTGEVIDLAPNYDNNLAFGADFNLSVRPLLDYIQTIGVRDFQKSWLKRLNYTLLCYIGYSIDVNLTDKYKEYFNRVNVIIKNQKGV
ncbi:hypothetical protein D3C81_10740 [compost metagenome]